MIIWNRLQSVHNIYTIHNFDLEKFLKVKRDTIIFEVSVYTFFNEAQIDQFKIKIICITCVF